MVLLRKRLNRCGNSLTSEDFNKGPVTSADQMITGKVAGLQVINGGLEKVLLLELEAVLHCLLIMTLYMSLIMFQFRWYQRRKKSIDNNQPKQYRIYYCFERCFCDCYLRITLLTG
jgi:hypothetical protein